jgi:predicted XRE-type DNA-binding protein
MASPPVAVNRLLESRRLTQATAATVLSINQPKISALKHYKLEGFFQSNG